MYHRFSNRMEAGRALAKRLEGFHDSGRTVVLALPRGGVPVAYEIARSLNVPLDVQVVRKLGVPGQRELAFGAIAPGGVTVFNQRLIDGLGLSRAAIDGVIAAETEEMKRREDLYRKGRPAPDLQGKTVILVDDGLATGATMRAAVESVRKASPAGIVVAVPVAAPDVCSAFDREPDVNCVSLLMPEPLYGVGWWYEDFGQTSDEQVCEFLEELRPLAAANGAARAS